LVNWPAMPFGTGRDPEPAQRSLTFVLDLATPEFRQFGVAEFKRVAGTFEPAYERTSDEGKSVASGSLTSTADVMGRVYVHRYMA
jgi:hypothetical protein